MVDPVGKPRIVTFKDRSTADNAVRYMARFMAKHGEWPIMDLSPDSNLNKVTKKEKPGDPDTEALMLESWNTSRMTLNAWPRARIRVSCGSKSSMFYPRDIMG